MLFGNVAAGEVHPQPHISVFGKAKKKVILLRRTHQFSLLCRKFGEAVFCCFSWVFLMNSGAWLHCHTVHFSEKFFFFEKPVRKV